MAFSNNDYHFVSKIEYDTNKQVKSCIMNDIKGNINEEGYFVNSNKKLKLEINQKIKFTHNGKEITGTIDYIMCIRNPIYMYIIGGFVSLLQKKFYTHRRIALISVINDSKINNLLNKFYFVSDDINKKKLPLDCTILDYDRFFFNIIEQKNNNLK